MPGPPLTPERLQSIDDAFVRHLRDAIVRAGYDDSVLAETEAIAPRKLDAVRVPLVLHHLRLRADGAAVLARLFAYGDTVTPSELAPWIEPGLRDAAIEAGILRRTGDRIASDTRILPFFGSWIATDDPAAAPDPVMGPGATTLELAHCIPTGTASLLDVGCGAGSLALVAARRGTARVVGVDIDPRAVAWSRFNARLNALSASFETGDLLAPVAGQTFALVVAQPPFVTLPPEVEATTYLHGGARGDELTLRLLAAIPQVLAPGGRAVVRFDAPGDDHAVLARVNPMLAGQGLQTVAVLAPGPSADAQAIAYAAERAPSLEATYARLVDRYRGHMRAQGITATRNVLLDVRRPEADGEPAFVVAIERSPRRPYDAADLEALRHAVDLVTRPDAELVQRVVVPAPRAALVHRQPLSADSPGESTFALHVPSGRAQDHALSLASATLLELIAEHGLVENAVRGYARACEATPDEVRSQVCAFVREGLVHGWLVERTP